MATTDDVAVQLAAHEALQKDRYEHIEHGLAKIKSAVGAEGKKMDNLGVLPLLMNQGGGTGTAMGAGLGSGVLGGFLASMLTRNGALGVGGAVDGSGRFDSIG